MKALLIAQAAHAINAAYCLSLGDTSQLPWADAPEWQQESALMGVEMHLANPEATPEQSHASWLAQKLADGWTYGEVKDAEKKQHPCCVPYDQLPPEQKAKDYIFRATVHVLKDLPDAELIAAEAVEAYKASLPAVAQVEKQLAVVTSAPRAAQPVLPSGIAVKYIGIRPIYEDKLYRTGLTFTQGQTRVVPPHDARKLLRHVDLFEPGKEDEVAAEAPAPSDDTEAQLKEGEAKRAEQHKREMDLADLHRSIDGMDFTTLAEFAEQRYGIKLHKNQGVEKGRRLVHQRIDQFGAV